MNISCMRKPLSYIEPKSVFMDELISYIEPKKVFMHEQSLYGPESQLGCENLFLMREKKEAESNMG